MKIDQPKIDRFLALLLIIGGGAGLIPGFWLLLQSKGASTLGLVLIMIMMFGLSVWIGIGLWRGRPRYDLWAQILFAVQIPIVTCSAFKYKFFTAMIMELSFEAAGEHKLNLQWELGSNLSFAIAPDTSDLVIGVNLLALAALAYLLCVPRKSTKSIGKAKLLSPDSQTAE